MRRSSPLSLAMIDIDHFKNYNDTFGHQAGDVALHHIAQIIAFSVERSNDFAARYGGEEFVVVLPDCTVADARDLDYSMVAEILFLLETLERPR